MQRLSACLSRLVVDLRHMFSALLVTPITLIALFFGDVFETSIVRITITAFSFVTLPATLSARFLRRCSLDANGVCTCVSRCHSGARQRYFCDLHRAYHDLFGLCFDARYLSVVTSLRACKGFNRRPCARYACDGICICDLPFWQSVKQFFY